MKQSIYLIYQLLNQRINNKINIPIYQTIIKAFHFSIFLDIIKFILIAFLVRNQTNLLIRKSSSKFWEFLEFYVHSKQ